MSVSLIIPLQSHVNIVQIWQGDLGLEVVGYDTYTSDSILAKGWESVPFWERRVTRGFGFFDTSVIPAGVTFEMAGLYLPTLPPKEPVEYQYWLSFLSAPPSPFMATEANWSLGEGLMLAAMPVSPTWVLHPQMIPYINRTGLTGIKLSGFNIESPIFGTGAAGWDATTDPIALKIVHSDPVAPERRKWPFKARQR